MRVRDQLVQNRIQWRNEHSVCREAGNFSTNLIVKSKDVFAGGLGGVARALS